MLQHIRDRFTGTFALALLALICVPFVFFGLSKYDFLGSGYAAKVNGEEISVQAYDNEYRRELMQYAQGKEVPDQLRSMIKQASLNRLIGETLVDQYLDERSYRIDNSMITNMIQQEPTFQVDGKFSKDTYYAWLTQQGQSPEMFEALQRQQLRLNQLQSGVGATSFVTPAEYRRFLNLYGQQRDVSVATFDIDAVAETVEVSDDDVQSYYDERPDQYQSPEAVDFNYVDLRRDTLREQAEVSEDELKTYYDESRDRYLQDERRRARHILIASGDDDDAAKAQATALAARAKAGEPLADLARQYSADSSTASNGGDLGLLPKSQLPDELGKAIFSMKKGEIVGPIKSEFGYHIIGLDEVVAGGPLPFEQVRAELERELRDKKADAAWSKLEDDVSDKVFDATDITAMAADLGLTVEHAEGFTRNGGAGFGRNQAAIDAVFDPSVLDDGRVSDVVELDANRSIVVQVTDHRKPELSPLDEVRDGIVSAIRNDRARQIVDKRSAALEAALADGTDFKDAAETNGADKVTVSSVKRQDAEIDANLRNAVFTLARPQGDSAAVGKAQTTTGDTAVFAVTAVTPGRPEAVPVADRDQGKQALAGQAGQSDYASVVLELQRRADIVRNQDALEQQNQY